MKILLAEDEESIARALKLMLEKNKYTVDLVFNGADALEHILSSEYDALVLDIMMPGLDGIEVLTDARSRGVTAPALFLTAKGEVEDRVAGLDAGADDYLPKPFATSEFLARVRALVRRSGAYAPSVLSFGGVELDCSRYTLRANGGELRLNNKEYQLMELFMRHPQQVFSTMHRCVEETVSCLFSELRCKEVIDLRSGQRLGYVCDAEFDPNDGKLLSLMVLSLIHIFWPGLWRASPRGTAS